ncbi:uncharacterized protein LOC108103769 [Drosophila eugracilis]|uniref:uncharacterized protein LOC108103769 n=1 Tax=Drosophila eugracilis TaxID=29029 RepID=UPI0007E73521|nr:uncharacterized protein LOC108103769 [Drosophila eugracilis]
MLLPELLLLLGLAVSQADSYDRSVNYWEAFAPGKLLQRLDALTVTDVDQSKVVKLPEIVQPVLAANQAQAKADEDVDVDVDVEAEAEADAADDNVDSLSAETSHEGYSGEDYERNYEQFVKEYFDRAAGENHDHDNDSYDLEEETQAEATNVKDQRCRRVKRKDGQLCEICRQLKNNEVSETCSYSHDDQPEQYAFGSGTQYKRYRNDPAEKEPAEETAPSSLCVRRQQDKSVCYECKDSKGQKIERCYDVQGRNAKTRKKKASSSSSSHSPHKRKPRSQQSQQSEQEQRIYKRTISYSYAQGTDQQPPAGTTALPVPRQRRRRLVKITRRRGPVQVQ